MRTLRATSTRRSVRCLATLLGGTMLAGGAAACGSDTPAEPDGPARTVVAVAAEAGDRRITTSPTVFADLLERVNYGNKVLVVVRGAAVAPLDLAAVLASPRSTDAILLLPAASETASVKRDFARGFAAAARDDVRAFAEVLRTSGAADVYAYENMPIISAVLQRDPTRLVATLTVLARHPNFDRAYPEEARVFHPGW